MEEDIYEIGSQKRSLLGMLACEILSLIRRVSIDMVESAEIYKRDHPKLFDGLGKIPGQYEIKLRRDSQPFAITTPRRISIALLVRPNLLSTLHVMQLYNSFLFGHFA